MAGQELTACGDRSRAREERRVGKILCATRGGEGSQRTQDAAISIANERAEEIVFIFVVDVGFLDQLAAPIVVDIEQRLEDMGRFEMARAKERASRQGVQAHALVRRGRLRDELIGAARELGASLIVLGQPSGRASVFERETLLAFSVAIQRETGIEVRIA
jgi:nucleotide-binding universal stress UspA family protein